MLQEKQEYLRHNPVRRDFVSSPERWRYPSAHEWLPALSRCCGATRGSSRFSAAEADKPRSRHLSLPSSSLVTPSAPKAPLRLPVREAGALPTGVLPSRSLGTREETLISARALI